MEKIWVDKYRPLSFSDILGQEQFVKRVSSFVSSKNLPHLLFAGSPGTGKTTTALVVARELYGSEGMRGNVLELNASDDRGIDVIRNQIKEFAKLKGLADVPYKIIILDEADSLTKEAQQALRRTMEKYSASCRFLLACNEISRIIDAIQSRCVVFKFKALKEEALHTLLQKVTETEGLIVSKDAQDLLVRVSRGDVRRLLNTLQAAASLGKEVNKNTIEEVMDFVDPKEIQVMISAAMKGDFFKAREELIKLRSIRGLGALEILKEIYKELLNLDLDSKLKVRLVDRIATVEFRIVEGSDEELQLEALLAMMALLK